MNLERIVIENVRPRTPAGLQPAKAVLQRPVLLSADIYRDGHDLLGARVRWRPAGDRKWRTGRMSHVGNDRWETTLTPDNLGAHEYVIEAWTDRYATWRHDVTVKHRADHDVQLELEEGARILEATRPRLPRAEHATLDAAVQGLRDATLDVDGRLAPATDAAIADLLADVADPTDLTRTRPLPVWVDRERALVGAWYEIFPRSAGGLAGTTSLLDEIAAAGFDVVYLPPIHPIGVTARKGPNNTLGAGPDDPGSPWAIGSAEGGHTAVHPDLGTLDDFDGLVAEARRLGMEIALDYALQCSPDHPWVSEHPEWFHQRPDGSIRYAENPPKRYQDIFPINFWPADPGDRQALWDACKEIFDFWVDHGVRIFRVDNPHTKPFAFWQWVIPAVQAEHADVIFLSEAFTRPKIMAKLAEIGFSQSYTYFTWRTGKTELAEYVTELAYGPTADYMRPNFWPNTPDILSGPLRGGSLGAFRQRLVLAATLSPSYGIYSGYELGENAPASADNEEYLNSEKYEIKSRSFHSPGSLSLWPFVSLLNQIRRRHPCLGELANVRFVRGHNDAMLAYTKHNADGSDVVLVVVNLDTSHPQEDTLSLDLGALGLPSTALYQAHDELTGDTYVWQGAHPYVRLTPDNPAHVLHLHP